MRPPPVKIARQGDGRAGDGTAREGRRLPVSARKGGKIGLWASADFHRRKLAIIAGLMLSRAGVPVACGGLIAFGLIGPAHPIVAAAIADWRADSGEKAPEMRDGAVRLTHPAKGDPARLPFKVGIVRPFGHVILVGEIIGRDDLAQPQHPPHKNAAAIAPFLWPPKRRGAAGLGANDLGCAVIAVLSHPPDKPLIGQTGIRLQRGRDGLDGGVDAISAAAQKDARPDQGGIAGVEKGAHGLGLTGQAAPRQFIRPIPVIGLDRPGVIGAVFVLLFRCHGQSAPGSDDFGICVFGAARCAQGLGPAQGACAGLRAL